MAKLLLSDSIFDDLVSFIHERYYDGLPNSLIIAQAFILKYPDSGQKYGLTEINKAIEDGIKRGLF